MGAYACGHPRTWNPSRLNSRAPYASTGNANASYPSRPPIPNSYPRNPSITSTMRTATTPATPSASPTAYDDAMANGNRWNPSPASPIPSNHKTNYNNLPATSNHNCCRKARAPPSTVQQKSKNPRAYPPTPPSSQPTRSSPATSPRNHAATDPARSYPADRAANPAADPSM